MKALEDRIKNLRWDVHEDFQEVEDKIANTNVMADRSLNEIDELRDVMRMMKRRLDGQEEEIEALRARLSEAEELIQDLQYPDPAGKHFYIILEMESDLLTLL